jgi:hypothetical protein
LLLSCWRVVLARMRFFSPETPNKTDGRTDFWQENSRARYEKNEGGKNWRGIYHR